MTREEFEADLRRVAAEVSRWPSVLRRDRVYEIKRDD